MASGANITETKWLQMSGHTAFSVFLGAAPIRWCQINAATATLHALMLGSAGLLRGEHWRARTHACTRARMLPAGTYLQDSVQAFIQSMINLIKRHHF